MQIEQALEKFLVQLDADGRSPHTRKQYERHIRLLRTWVAEVGLCGDIKAIDHEHVARFLSSPHTRTRHNGGLKRASSVNCLRSSLKTFFGYLREAGYIRQNPSRLVRRALCGTPPPRALSQDEQDRLMAALAEENSYEAKRDYLFIHLSLSTGLRLGSIVALDVSDIDLEEGVAWLRTMKNNQVDRVYLGQKIREHLAEYMTDRFPGPLFTDRNGRRLSSRHIQRRFKLWLKRSKVKRAVTFHSLRHSCAISLYRRTGDIYLVKEALCHRSIMSAIVYAQVDANELRHAFL